MTHPIPAAVRKCPTCGQPLPKNVRLLLDAAQLLQILTSGEPHREVYRGDGTNQWFVTYGGGEASAEAVQELVAAGKIRSLYSNCPNDAYHVGRTIDMEATVAARQKIPGHAKRSIIVYVEDPT